MATIPTKAPYALSFAERMARMAAKPKLDVQVCDHCNLRCAGCLHFAPLAEKSFLDVESYERDLSRLTSIDGFEGYSKKEQSILTGRSPENITVHVEAPEGAGALNCVGKIVDVSIEEAKTWYLRGRVDNA